MEDGAKSPETDTQSATRAANALHLTFMTCAVRALIASHPNRPALLEAWNQEMAALWPNAAAAFRGEILTADAMRQTQATWETLVKGSLGA